MEYTVASWNNHKIYLKIMSRPFWKIFVHARNGYIDVPIVTRTFSFLIPIQKEMILFFTYKIYSVKGLYAQKT